MCLIWVLCTGLCWLVGFDLCLFFQVLFYDEGLSRLISFISCDSLGKNMGFVNLGRDKHLSWLMGLLSGLWGRISLGITNSFTWGF